MSSLLFYQIDAFTAQPCSGNPVGVISNAIQLSEKQMRRIAREIHLPVTAFVCPPQDHRAKFRIRFLTPTFEENLPAHAVLGAFYVLAKEKRVPVNLPVASQLVETRAGLLRVQLFIHHEEAHRITLQLPLSQSKEVDLERDEIAGVLGIEATQIRKDLPLEIRSSSSSQLFVPLKSLEVLGELKPNFSALAELNRRLETRSTHVFVLDSHYAGGCCAARHFCPAVGIREDPATGTAAGALGEYLVCHGIKKPGEMLMEQGNEIGRPATLCVEVCGTRDRIQSVTVGGRAVQVMAGELFI